MAFGSWGGGQQELDSGSQRAEPKSEHWVATEKLPDREVPLGSNGRAPPSKRLPSEKLKLSHVSSGPPEGWPGEAKPTKVKSVNPLHITVWHSAPELLEL